MKLIILLELIGIVASVSDPLQHHDEDGWYDPFAGGLKSSADKETQHSTVAQPSCTPPVAYFKHFVTHFSDHMKPITGVTETLYVLQVGISEARFQRLQTLLDTDGSEKEILDLMIDSFQLLPPEEVRLESSDKTFYRILITLGALVSVLIVWYWWNVLTMYSWYKSVLLVVLICFFISIPWEWYRMYKEALAKKTAATSNNIPRECFPEKLNTWNTLQMWLRESFSTSADKCAKYHEAILVDPLWEVSPLMAASASGSRLFVIPFKQFAATFGESFRLFFDEIPVQWQPFMFVASFVLLIAIVMACSGFEISTPLLRVGVRQNNDHQHRAAIQQLQEQNRELIRQLSYKAVQDSDRVVEDVGVRNEVGNQPHRRIRASGNSVNHAGSPNEMAGNSVNANSPRGNARSDTRTDFGSRIAGNDARDAEFDARTSASPTRNSVFNSRNAGNDASDADVNSRNSTRTRNTDFNSRNAGNNATEEDFSSENASSDTRNAGNRLTNASSFVFSNERSPIESTYDFLDSRE